jgi:hypothetical protein
MTDILADTHDDTRPSALVPGEAMAFLLDIPHALSQLVERISEGLPNAEAKAFRSDFIQGVNTRADLDNVWPHFAVWLFLDTAHGVWQYAIPINKKCMQAIVRTYQRVLEGQPLDASEWLRDAHKGTPEQIAHVAYNYAALHGKEAA